MVFSEAAAAPSKAPVDDANTPAVRRSAVMAQADFLSACRIEKLGRHHAAMLAQIESQCFSSFWDAEQYAAAFDEPWFAAYGIFCQGHMAGYITMSILGDELEVSNIALWPVYRGKGLATALMGFALAAALKERHWQKAFLEVRQNNQPAIRLYARLGFTVSGMRKGYYSDGTNALCMTLASGDLAAEVQE